MLQPSSTPINAPTGGAGPPATENTRTWAGLFRLPGTLLNLSSWFRPPERTGEEDIAAHQAHSEQRRRLSLTEGFNAEISQEIPPESGEIDEEQLPTPVNKRETSIERRSNTNLGGFSALGRVNASISENQDSEAMTISESNPAQVPEEVKEPETPNWGSNRDQTTSLADDEWDIIEGPSAQLNVQNGEAYRTLIDSPLSQASANPSLNISTTNLTTHPSISVGASPQSDYTQNELPQHEVASPPQSRTGPEHAQDLTTQVTEITRFPVFEGSHSSVYRGRFGDQEVAIKTLRSLKSTTDIQEGLLQRLDTWTRLRHQKILTLYGFIRNAEFGRFPTLVSLWCENGNAGNFLSKPRSAELRVNLFCDVAQGIQYLHGLNPPVVHGDLKPANVLIDRESRAKLCDFGLTSFIHEHLEDAMTTVASSAGTTRYLAHELIDSDEDQPPTTASDMYAVGCIGLEFLYSIVPFASIRDSAPRAQFKICREIGSGKPPAERPKGLSRVPADLWDEFEACWNAQPSDRPSADDICLFLDRESHDITSYLTQKSVA